MISYIKGLVPEAELDSYSDTSTEARGKLTKYFVHAFLQGITNANGRCAVFAYLESLAGLIKFVDHKGPLPTPQVRHTTSCTVGDSFDIAMSPTVRTRSRSVDTSSQATSPPLKRPRTSEKIRKVNSYCDLVVVSPDYNHKNYGKYLFIVEVHSHGKALTSCLKKLSEEMVHVLQSQREVFGLIFGSTNVMLLKARRLHLNDNIVITNKYYYLFSDRYFDVCSFQELTMAIFSILVYAIITLSLLG